MTDDWKDISSAPKDGTEFLGCIDWAPSFPVSICRYRVAKHGKPYWSKRGAYEPIYLTHWMPLPERKAKQPRKRKVAND